MPCSLHNCRLLHPGCRCGLEEKTPLPIDAVRTLNRALVMFRITFIVCLPDLFAMMCTASRHAPAVGGTSHWTLRYQVSDVTAQNRSPLRRDRVARVLHFACPRRCCDDPRRHYHKDVLLHGRLMASEFGFAAWLRRLASLPAWLCLRRPHHLPEVVRRRSLDDGVGSPRSRDRHDADARCPLMARLAVPLLLRLLMARRLDDAHRGPGPGLDEFDRGLVPSGSAADADHPVDGATHNVLDRIVRASLRKGAKRPPDLIEAGRNTSIRFPLGNAGTIFRKRPRDPSRDLLLELPAHAPNTSHGRFRTGPGGGDVRPGGREPDHCQIRHPSRLVLIVAPGVRRAVKI